MEIFIIIILVFLLSICLYSVLKNKTNRIKGMSEYKKI